jgi:retron-type reverse transcriptase
LKLHSQSIQAIGEEYIVRRKQAHKTKPRWCVSPLLSNLMQDDLDEQLERRGPRFVRYADDCNAYVCRERTGRRMVGGLKAFLTSKLKVNEATCAVAQLHTGTHTSEVSRETCRPAALP